MLIHHLGYLNTKKIVLASQSPRRSEILKMLGIPFIIQPSSFEENLPKSDFSGPDKYAIATAHGKAVAVARQMSESGGGAADLVIGSDTIVVLGGAILEKPANEAEAIQMLKRLSGKQHSVVTAVSLITGKGAVRQFASETAVWFDELSAEVIHAYVRGGEPMDKAGAYGIQGMGGSFVQRIEGCYFTVMGLPLHGISKEIRKLVDDELI